VSNDILFLAAGLGLGFGVLLVAGVVLAVLEQREREPRGVVSFRPGAVRALLMAAPLQPGHPWSPGEGLDPAGDLVAVPGTEHLFLVKPPDPEPTPPPDPCEPERTAVTVASEHAGRQRAVVLAAGERLAAQQRAYDEHVVRRDTAAAALDPRAVRAAKDLAQARFHQERQRASDRAGRDQAAAAWLHEIDEINARIREAAATLDRETAEVPGLLRQLERAGYEADGARLAAHRAADALLTARLSLSACEERERVGAPAGGRPVRPPVGRPDHRGLRVIGRLLQGDHAAMTSLVDALGGSDLDERRRWQLLVSDLVDAIVSRAIDAASLEFPDRHVLWGSLPASARRDVAAALGALGFRFDGLGGFTDGRVPSQRDLSLAVGQAGVEQNQVRPWPAEADLPLLYRNVRVDAAGFVDAEAGGLTLGEMVELLGRRAEPLAELWNAWGRIRPLLADD
jgi:hypothetical protein